MASVSMPDTNALVAFILRWLFAGFWGCVGWAYAAHFLIPHLPGI